MAASNALAEKQSALTAKQKELGELFELARDGDRFDYSRTAFLEKLGATDADDADAKMAALNIACDELAQDVRQLKARAIEESHKERDAQLKRPIRAPLPGMALVPEVKSFGQLVVESKQYLEARQEKRWPAVLTVDLPLKTLMTTAAGWAPRDPRIPRVVDAVTRPVQVLDLIPIDPTDSSQIHYMLETTRTQAAAEVAEGVAYAEDAFALTQQDEPVRKIGSILPVTDEQLADVAQVRAYIDNRMRFGLRQRLDGQVVVGNGTAPNLSGITDRSGIQTQAKGADPVFDAIFKALTLVRVTGRAMPDAVLLHPNDWQEVRLTRTADGVYIMGNPDSPGFMTLFGLPVVLCESLTEGTGLVGDFAGYTQLWEKQGIELRLGFTGDQFKEGEQTMRADVRVAFCVYRPAAFCTVTGI